MLDKSSDFRLGEGDVGLLGKLAIGENLLLATVTVIAALNILGWLAPAVRDLFKGGWSPMSAEAAVACLLSTAGLLLSRPRYTGLVQSVSMGIAILLAACSALVLAGRLVYPAPPIVSGTASWFARGMSPHAALCFVLVGMATFFIRTRGRAGIAADFSTVCLLFTVAVLVSGQVLGVLGTFSPSSTYVISGQAAFCLLLLACVIFLRRAEKGLFSILMGDGIGSKVARVIAPLLIVLPYFREGMRAHFINSQRMPPNYVTALLATMAMTFSIALMMYLAWRLNALETEIHGLSLRDPLTGLYNLRGFRLLSEQAMLLARRSGHPYSVLFIDVDNLKQINDILGHQAGSDLLTATADILREVFRETDVLGRMGGDEFAVAGQFSRSGIADAADRLRQASMLYNAGADRATLRFSAGWVTSDPEQRVPLSDLLAKADAEMYREKRRRKVAGRKMQAEMGLPHSAQNAGAEGSNLRETANR